MPVGHVSSRWLFLIFDLRRNHRSDEWAGALQRMLCVHMLADVGGDGDGDDHGYRFMLVRFKRAVVVVRCFCAVASVS